MKIAIYTQDGTQKGDTKVNEVFQAECNDNLIALGLRYQMCSARRAVATVKTKAQVRGGGRKPYRQKGTGRARQGSIRNPHYRGGGVAFGPRAERNFAIKMPKKQRSKALLQALSKKLQANNVFLLEKFDKKDAKTKDFAKLLQNLPVERSVLIVAREKNDSLEKCSSNMGNVKIILENYLNIYDLLKYEKVCFLDEAFTQSSERFAKNHPVKSEKK